MLKSDRGGEYELSFADICIHNEIIEITKPYSPQSNGVVEQNNCTLKEMMNVMQFWSITKHVGRSSFDY